MTTVSSATHSTSTAATTTSSSTSLDSSDFLSLLTTELQNQDPLDPVDSTETVTQLAEYSELESLISIEDYVSAMSTTLSDSMSSMITSVDYSTGVSLLNQNVRMAVDSVEYEGEDVTININMGTNSSTTVELLNEDGDVVKTFNATADDDGNAELTWNGISELDGTEVDDGTYTISITGSSSDATLYAYTKGTVTGVKSDDGTIMLTVDGADYSMEDIVGATSN